MKLEGKILAFLLKNVHIKKPIYSKDIQKEFRIKKAFASWHLTRLEREGLISRKKDGKKKRILITKLGQNTIMSEILTEDEIKLISIKKRLP